MKWLIGEGREHAHNITENQGEATISQREEAVEKGKEKKILLKETTAQIRAGLKGQEQSAIRAPGLAAPSRRIRWVSGGGASGQKPLRQTVTWRSLAVLPAKEIGTKRHLS